MEEDLAPEILKAERDRIRDRRKAAGIGQGQPAEDSVGLALSGGGIRSATFNLGLLQAMAQADLLKRVDYLSTVSGGGYIGASLTWFMTKLKQSFPFGTSRQDSHTPSAAILHWLRSHGRYLAPGRGMNLWSLSAAVLTGLIVNLTVLAPVFTFLFWGLTRDLSRWLGTQTSHADQAVPAFSLLSLFFLAGLLLTGVFLLQVLFFALTSRMNVFRNYRFQRGMRKTAGRLLMGAALLLAMGTIPEVYRFVAAHFGSWLRAAMSSITLSGIVAIGGALFRRPGGKDLQGPRSLLISVGLALLVYGLCLWLYHWVHADTFNERFLFWSLPLSLILALTADINHVSMHRFYRNQLMAAYFPFKLMKRKYTQADQCLLKDLEQTAAPYHILCANVQTVGSKDSKLRERGGDSFIFSPLYSGSSSTAYLPSSEYVGGQMNLATAMAISGAAVDANTYATRSRPLAFLMALLNVRLGYWTANPRKYATQFKWLRPTWYLYMFAEMLGSGLSEEKRSIHLSDGGHFENLGLYELLRRRCRIIIVGDGACDAAYAFSDLAKCMEMARVDFGAKIDIDVRPLRPDVQTGISSQPFAVGVISYRDGQRGVLLYVKATLMDQLGEDLYAYRRQFGDFPNQSTGDQFFNEPQFEAYRELGFRIGQRAFGGLAMAGVDQMETSLLARRGESPGASRDQTA